MTTTDRPTDATCVQSEIAAPADPRRWVTLGIILMASCIVVIDTTVLFVAIPTILREFDTTLPSLQWVITGYSLTFASLLIIGGRLGDVFGARRTFIAGATLFGIGSLIASVSQSTPELIFGEAVVEGIGAAMMIPATLSILSRTFSGRERASAFAAWGAVAGTAAAFGPVIGGFLTTNYSWRWAFRINVIVAPLAVIGALLFMRGKERTDRTGGIDVPGALLVAGGVFLLVFGLSQGDVYGWLTPRQPLTIGGTTVWPASWPVSAIPFVFALSIVLLTSFVVYERGLERNGGSPLFEFSLLRANRSLRFGLATQLVLSMGQMCLLFVLPLFLQDGKNLTAEQNGLWLLPLGLFVIVGAQSGARIARRIGTVRLIRIGLVTQAIGLVYIAATLHAETTLLQLMPGFILIGTGMGFSFPQLTNVILEHVAHSKTGVVSGASTTVRQIGLSLGVAVMGALVTAITVRVAVDDIVRTKLAAGVRAHAVTRLHSLGTNFTPPAAVNKGDLATLHDIFVNAVGSGARFALFFAAIVVSTGAAVSFLIPRDEPPPPNPAFAKVEAFEAFEPIDPDPALVDGVDTR
jgi:EmrB/QacA subfamily drug resistance transporter